LTRRSRSRTGVPQGRQRRPPRHWQPNSRVTVTVPVTLHAARRSRVCTARATGCSRTSHAATGRGPQPHVGRSRAATAVTVLAAVPQGPRAALAAAGAFAAPSAPQPHGRAAGAVREAAPGGAPSTAAAAWACRAGRVFMAVNIFGRLGSRGPRSPGQPGPSAQHAVTVSMIMISRTVTACRRSSRYAAAGVPQGPRTPRAVHRARAAWRSRTSCEAGLGQT
jgi:hypothetical protein